jgi:hypothetical protein
MRGFNSILLDRLLAKLMIIDKLAKCGYCVSLRTVELKATTRTSSFTDQLSCLVFR